MKIIKFLLKLLVVIGLLYFLVQKGVLSISLSDTKRALTKWDSILPALAILLTSNLIGVVRWQILLRAQDICLPWFKTFELSMIGNFFNIALPGAVSGDVVKAFYVGREAKGARAKAFGSILFDRIIGLSAMVITPAIAIGLGFKQFWGSPLFHAIRFFLSVSAIGFVVFFAYLFLLDEKADLFLKLLKNFEKRFSFVGSILRIYEGIKGYHHRRWAVVQALALSSVIQVFAGLNSYFLLQALGDSNMTLLSLYVVVPLGLLVTAIPLLPGGVGTGHAAFGFLFGLLGSQRGADVFTLLALYNILIGGVGGLIYLRFKTAGEIPDLKEIKA